MILQDCGKVGRRPTIAKSSFELFAFNLVLCILIIILWQLLRRGAPLPIPNREVKPCCADDTANLWESRSLPKPLTEALIWMDFVSVFFWLFYLYVLFVIEQDSLESHHFLMAKIEIKTNGNGNHYAHYAIECVLLFLKG